MVKQARAQADMATRSRERWPVDLIRSCDEVADLVPKSGNPTALCDVLLDLDAAIDESKQSAHGPTAA